MRKMRDSGIEWVGAIPAAWGVHRIASHFQEIKEKNTANAYSNALQFKMGKIIAKPQKWDEDETNETYSAYTVVHPNTIMINGLNLEFDFVTQRVARVECNGIITSAYIALSPRDDINAEYICYLLKSYDACRAFHSMGRGLRKILSYSELKNKPIVVPPLAEQERIAAFLDAECAEIDAVLEKTRASIEEYKKLKQAVITQAVTKGIRGDRPMKDSGIEWIGEIPAEWTASKIKYCTEFAPSCNTSHLSEDSLVTFTPMECIKNGYFENREAHFSALSSSYTQYQDGDIVFAKVTPCFENGNIAIMQGLSAGVGFGSSELFVIRPQSINTEFIFYYLQNDIFKQYACATMTGTGGLKRVSPTFVRNYSVFIPCNEEQLEIVRYLNEKCSGIEVLIAKKQQYLTEIENYKKSLIYEYVTGKKEVI